MRACRVLYAALLAVAVATPGEPRDLPAGAITLHGARATMMALPGGAPRPVFARRENGAGLVTIFSSLASKYPKGVYWCCTGYNVMGANSGAGVQWMAGAFTPADNYRVTQIEVAAGYSGQGPNGVVISLNADDNGVPGKPLKTWNVSNLPTFGTCCVTAVKTDKGGIAVSGGTQYWVVLSTNSNETDTVDGWNVSDADQVDQANLASWDGSIWHTFQAAPGLAFAVRGN